MASIPPRGPAATDEYAGVPTAVVYDVFADTETELAAIYVERARDAATDDERAAWWAKVMALRDRKRAVPARDRAALIAHITQWRAEIRALRGRGG